VRYGGLFIGDPYPVARRQIRVGGRPASPRLGRQCRENETTFPNIPASMGEVRAGTPHPLGPSPAVAWERTWRRCHCPAAVPLSRGRVGAGVPSASEAEVRGVPPATHASPRQGETWTECRVKRPGVRGYPHRNRIVSGCLCIADLRRTRDRRPL